MANLLLALAFVIALFYGYRVVTKLDQFLDSGKIEREDPNTEDCAHRQNPDAEARFISS